MRGKSVFQVPLSSPALAGLDMIGDTPVQSQPGQQTVADSIAGAEKSVRSLLLAALLIALKDLRPFGYL